MPFYVKQGQIPHKRHIAFAKENGELYREELFSTHGFSNIYSNKYHHNMPTKALEVAPMSLTHGDTWVDSLVQNYKLDSRLADGEGNFFSARNKIFFNSDVALYTAKVTADTDEFYRNAYADEVVFVHEGDGVLLSEYGELEVKKWDYLVIPRGTTYQLKFNDYSNVRLFVIESFTMVEIPKHFRNEYGQLLESAPYCERDIRVPELKDAVVERGNFPLVCKFGDKYQLTQLEWHPLIWWAGTVLCIPGLSTSPNTRPRWAKSTCRRRITCCLWPETSLSATLCRAPMISTRRQFRPRTTITTSTATKCSITSTVIL